MSRRRRGPVSETVRMAAAAIVSELLHLAAERMAAATLQAKAAAFMEAARRREGEVTDG
jgi:hypothetical protein